MPGNGTLASATLLARFVCAADAASLPSVARMHGRRAFLNWIGCAFGGSRHAAVDVLLNSLADMGAPETNTVIGRMRKTDMQYAALINGLTSSIYAFDDTHVRTVTHPTGPVAGALLAYAEQNHVSGRHFLAALVLGVDIECRLSNALSDPPGECSVGWYLTGVTGAAGAAAAVGRLMGLGEADMTHAIGLGAMQGAGFRQAHGTMCLGFVPGHAARAGLLAAFMARRGFTCTAEVLEGRNGFFDVFARRPNAEALTRGLGEHFEIEDNLCKPYPAGIFIHAAIDACLDVRAASAAIPDSIRSVALRVHPLGVGLTGRSAPRNAYEALVSIYHWVAVALLTGRAGLDEVTDEMVRDPAVLAIRQKIDVRPDETLARDEAHITVVLRDGNALSAHVPHALGSALRPLDDDEVRAKFLALAEPFIPSASAERIALLCAELESVEDMRTVIAALKADRSAAI